MSQIELEARYLAALNTMPMGKEVLATMLQAEDDYSTLALNLIRANGGEHILHDYQHPFAFSGGGAEGNDVALQRICTSLHQASRKLDIDTPDILARWWPSTFPNARSSLGQGGVLISMNTGLLCQLRFLLHLVCGKAFPEAGSEFRRMLDECIGGDAAPLKWTVRVNQHGAQENARRKATIAGLAYVLAHELGHHVWRAKELSEAASDHPEGAETHGLPYSEPQAVSAFASEMEADVNACRILLAWAPELAMDPLDLLVGAAAVLTIHVTLFWLEAARRTQQLAWTHPFPDLRIAGVAMALLQPGELRRLEFPGPFTSEESSEALDPRARTVINQLEDLSGAAVFRSAALKQGLEGTGLTSLQRMMVYFVYGTHEANMTDDTKKTETVDIKYSRGTPQDWDVAVQKFKITRRMVTGACPRCGHLVERDLSDRIGNTSAPESGIKKFVWQCSCGKPHEGAPAGDYGCGAEGIINVGP